MVRDLVTSCGKQVQIEIVGKETELDKSLLEAIKDPLTHLVLATAVADRSDDCPHAVARTVDEAIVNAWNHQRECLGERVTQRPFCEAWNISRPKLAALVGASNGTNPHETESEPPPDTP